MSGICILAAGKATVLAASLFTLAWTHSVEKIDWQEDWRLTPSGLEIVVARVKGSGAGMEPSPDAVLKDGWWTYVPSVLRLGPNWSWLPLALRLPAGRYVVPACAKQSARNYRTDRY